MLRDSLTLVSATVRAVVVRKITAAYPHPGSARENAALKPGDVGRLHTRFKRNRNGLPALVVAVHDKGVRFRVATYETGADTEPFADLFASWGKFTFFFADRPEEFREGGEPLLILALLSHVKRLGMRGFRPDFCEYERQLLRRIMRTAPPQTMAYVLERVVPMDERALVPQSSEVRRSTLGPLCDPLYDLEWGTESKKRVRALIDALIKRDDLAHAYDVWLFNDAFVSGKAGRRFMRAFTREVKTFDLFAWCAWPQRMGWGLALIHELLRRDRKGEIPTRNVLLEHVARLLAGSGIAQYTWMTLPRARMIAKHFGMGRAKFWRLYVQK